LALTSHTGASARSTRIGKHALRDISLCQVFFRDLVLALPDWTMHNRNAIPMNATAEAARHEPQVLSVVQRLPPISHGLPPHTHKPPAARPIWNQHSTRIGPAAGASFALWNTHRAGPCCPWRRYARAMVATLGAKARLIAASSCLPSRYCCRYYS